MTTKQVCIVRPRDRTLCHYRLPFSTQDLLWHFSVAKKVKLEGYALYERIEDEREISSGSELLLSWKSGRGGSAPSRYERSVDTTVTFVPSRSEDSSGGQSAARERLGLLEDLLHRIRTDQ